MTIHLVTGSLSFSPTCDRGLARKRLKQAVDLALTGAGSPGGIPDSVVGFATGMLALTASAGLVLPLAIAVPINRYREKMRNRRSSQQAQLLFRNLAPRSVSQQNNNFNNNNN